MCFAVVCSATAALCSRQLSFEEWCAKYGKTYGTHEEQYARERVFYQNAALVQTLNTEYRYCPN